MTTFGAIRWDAWYSEEPNAPALYTANSLSPAKFQNRAPFFTQVLSPNRIRFQWSVSTMEQEINFAVMGGLSYWAFLRYNSPDPMTKGLELYQQASNKSLLKWCSIEGTNTLGGTGGYIAQSARLVAEMQQSNYQRVMSNRPLIYIYHTASQVATWWSGNIANFKTAIDRIRADAIAAGLQNPYIVVMEGGGTAANALRISLGADAITNYTTRIPDNLAQPFSVLNTATLAYWDELRLTGSPIVPICQMGWDRRPRIERPVFWERVNQKPFFRNLKYFDPATNAQLVSQIQSALNYVSTYPVACESDTILAYAWNEFDEGGWLCPTLDDPTGARLAAIAQVLI